MKEWEGTEPVNERGQIGKWCSELVPRGNLVCEFEGEVIIITAHSDSELVAQGGPEPNLSDIQLGYSHVVVVVVGRNPTSVSPTPLSEHP